MEVEVKLTYKDRQAILEWLKRNEFELVKRKEVKDSYFGSDFALSNKKNLYRMRTVVGEFTELTMKDRLQDNTGVWSRREINVRVDDPMKMLLILSSLGCNYVKSHASKREIWQKGKVSFQFIDYYKPTFLSLIEVEGKDKKIVRGVVKGLGDLVEVAGEEIFEVFDKKTAQ